MGARPAASCILKQDEAGNFHLENQVQWICIHPAPGSCARLLAADSQPISALEGTLTFPRHSYRAPDFRPCTLGDKISFLEKIRNLSKNTNRTQPIHGRMIQLLVILGHTAFTFFFPGSQFFCFRTPDFAFRYLIRILYSHPDIE